MFAIQAIKVRYGIKIDRYIIQIIWSYAILIIEVISILRIRTPNILNTFGEYHYIKKNKERVNTALKFIFNLLN